MSVLNPISEEKVTLKEVETEPSLLRKRLFLRSKPTIRKMTAEDIAWLWAAYKMGSFSQYNLPEMNESDFKKFVVMKVVPAFHEVDIIEDHNRAFSVKKGPVALVTTGFDGWRLEPHVDWFKWATPKNVLRGTVAYLQKSRWRKDVGVVVVRSLDETKNVFDHASKYGVTHRRGRIPHGDVRGDEYIFSMNGNKGRNK